MQEGQLEGWWFWDKRVLELVGLEVGIFSISCRFKNCEDGFMWFFTGVYGPTMKRYREPFWEELGAIRGLWSDPWCIGGDFNVIRFPSERSRVGRLSGSMRRFSEVLDELALRDLPLQGGPYTWSGGLNGQSRRGPIPFRFENMWLKEEGFKELLKGCGGELEDGFGQSFFWDDQERQRTLNEQELEARKEAKEEFKKWAIMEEISWRQKSRQIWLKEGDKNTGFFHKMANSNRLLSDPGGWHPSMSSLEFDRIGRGGCQAGGDVLWKSPKKGGAEDLRDYRPQLGGWSVQDSRQALIANEAIDSLLKGDEAGVLCKLDLEKAYDHINWDFLMSVMQKMGLGRSGLAGSGGASPLLLLSLINGGASYPAAGKGKGWKWDSTISGLNINWKRAKFCRWEELRMLRSWLLNWVQSGFSSFHLLGAASRCSSQIGGCVGWCGRKDEEETRFVEEAVHF
ncbi:hypothetical protein CK203_095454 [Vitis vinifera]|uniref:Reverse transcriptase domain-containing protein n=1 Tax=Vitis vinifera TaxID=29760 RepID=A0A438EJ29_VITVI|nr:hypothetical protein CK203_095454 [Vitis vinifera]